MKKKEVKLECNNSSPGRLNCEVAGVSNCCWLCSNLYTAQSIVRE